MDGWGPTIVAGAITLLGWAFTYGTLTQSLRNTIERVENVEEDLDKHKDQIWPRVGKAEENIAKINGHLGINGSAYRGKGHHV
jgi:membrane protein implicated in regulation of membrane protease activity